MPTQLLKDEKAFPISYTESKPPEKIDAIFIKDIEELCGIDADAEEVTPEEVKALIININNMLAENKVPSYIDIPLDTYDQVIKMTDTHISGVNHIKMLLLKQRGERYEFSDFQDECTEKKCENVHLGGIYGRACVWDRARRMAKNIYSRQLGDHHPNIRFFVKDDPAPFENAIINPAITQGYFGESDPEFQDDNPTFDFYVKFDATKTIEISEADNETFAEESDEYFVENPHDGFYDKNYKLYSSEANTKNHNTIFQKMNDTLKVKPALTSDENTRAFPSSSSNTLTGSSSVSSNPSSSSSNSSSSSHTSTSSAQMDLNFLNTSNKRKTFHDDKPEDVSIKKQKGGGKGAN